MYFVMSHDASRRNAIKAVTEAPEGYSVTIKEPRRSGSQNAMFHAICSDLSRSGLHWAGQPRTLEQWKCLLVSGHAIATKQGGEVIPGLENEFVAVRESTASMSKARGASLISYAMAFMDEHEVKLTARGW